MYPPARRGVNDSATPNCRHNRDCRAAQLQGGFDVHGQRRGNICVSELLSAGRGDHACVVDEDVEASEPIMDLFGQGIAKAAVGEVTVKTGVGGGRQNCGIKVCYSHPRAFRRKSGYERLARYRPQRP